MMSKKVLLSEGSVLEFSAVKSNIFPRTRYKQAVCLHNRHIYVHGGIDRNISYKDVWRYDIDLCMWEKLKDSGDKPPNLQSHTMTVYKDLIYVFGGNFWFDGSDEIPLWTYEVSSNVWRKPDINKEEGSPSSRRCHSAVLYRDCLYIYGGYIDLKGSSEEFWQLDLERNLWSILRSDQSPGPRHSHSAVVNKDTMWLCGGMSGLKLRTDLWCWNFRMMNWMKVKQSGPELVEHSAVSLGTHMLVFGGVRDGLPQKDLWLFSYMTFLWQKVSHCTLPALSHHSTLVIPPERCSSSTPERTSHLVQRKQLHSKSEKIFRNKVLPSDIPHNCEDPDEIKAKSFEKIDSFKAKHAWVENYTNEYPSGDLGLSLKHYGRCNTLHEGIDVCSPAFSSNIGDRHASMCQTNSWESGLSESDPLIKTTLINNLKETTGFINMAYLNASRSNSSIETVETERQPGYARISSDQFGKTGYLQHSVKTGSFNVSEAELQLYSFTRDVKTKTVSHATMERNPTIPSCLQDNVAKLSSFGCDDIVVENIENVSDTDICSEAELLPDSQISNLPSLSDSDTIIDPVQSHCEALVEGTPIVTLYILGGRQLRKRNFAEIKNMSLWKFQINMEQYFNV